VLPVDPVPEPDPGRDPPLVPPEVPFLFWNISSILAETGESKSRASGKNIDMPILNGNVKEAAKPVEFRACHIRHHRVDILELNV
jgi:hypothetical protein